MPSDDDSKANARMMASLRDAMMGAVSGPAIQADCVIMIVFKRGDAPIVEGAPGSALTLSIAVADDALVPADEFTRIACAALQVSGEAPSSFIAPSSQTIN